MKLNEEGIREKNLWEEKGYHLPEYDRAAMKKKTKEAPAWVHFGAGNIFRAFQANAAQTMLEAGESETGIIVAEGFDYEIVEKMYRPNDNLSILVTLKSDGSVEKTVVGSIAESLILDAENEAEFSRLKEIFASDSLQMATFTITEKGYALANAKGEVPPDIAYDFSHGPSQPKSYMGKVVALLYHRFASGQKPIAMVSTDNCSHNGDKLYAAVEAFATHWVENKLVEEGFLAYCNDHEKVSFPWTMIDKITPRPDASVEQILRSDQIEDLDAVVTSKNTYVAPFVNAEETEYLVIEDAFPNGRPALERAGFYFTDRQTVDKVEKMKVCTCLNPLHTALAVFGCLLGYEKISDEMNDADLKKLVETIGYKEGLPVVTDPGILHPKEFIDTVVQKRLPNPFMPDTPQRIATDTSQKLSIRFGETIKNYISAGRDTGELVMIPLVFAAWLRYLMGIDDEGKEFALSPDPMLAELQPYIASLHLGEPVSEETLMPLLTNQTIFGVDLYEAGLSDAVVSDLQAMLSGVGAVRATLHENVR